MQIIAGEFLIREKIHSVRNSKCLSLFFQHVDLRPLSYDGKGIILQEWKDLDDLSQSLTMNYESIGS